MPLLAQLHVHTDASKDGLGSVDRLAKGAAEQGFKWLAMTDHGTLANAVAFSQACFRHGVSPILGLEAYIGNGGSQIYHLTLLADGNEGFRELVRLNNIGIRSEGSRPVIPMDELLKSKHLILLTGCPTSPLNRLPLEEAIELGARLKMTFGKNMYSELMVPFDDKEEVVKRQMILARSLDISHVVTTDAHFPYKADGLVHGAVTEIRAGYEYTSKNLWFRGMEELGPRLLEAGMSREEVVEAMKNTNHLAASIKVCDLRGKPKDILPRIEAANSKLRAICASHMPYTEKKYVDRLDYELSIIREMGYASYFLILKDIVDAAKELKCRVGPGRGSGAGSLVLYILGITEVDPLKFGLSFERFLNPERRGMPDVDIDFESERRGDVITYARKKWGALPIATYSTFSHKSLVRGLAKYYKLPRDLEERLADSGRDSEHFTKACELEPLFRSAYEALLGQIRHKGKHAGGVVIAKDMGLVPLERASGVEVAAWAEGGDKDLSYAGYVKFDLLGLSALSTLRRLEEKHGRRAGEPTKDDPAFTIFKKGLLTGIFQFSGSDGIRKLTMEVLPNKLGDLIAINALYRPGALDSGSTAKFVEWREKPRKVNPLFEDILAETYGAIVYQEQVMEIIAKVMGGSLAEADLGRRIIVKSDHGNPEWHKKMSDFRTRFIEGAVKAGIAAREADKLWRELETHTRYSFNKAHSTAYAMIAWEMAWWKWNYPADFLCAMLNTDPQHTQNYMVEIASSAKIELTMPHVNISGVEYVSKDDKIYMPLAEIKYMGAKGADHIVTVRAEGGEFTSLEDFMARVQKKLVRARAREGLWQLGGFEGIEGTGDILAINDDATALLGASYGLQSKYLGFVIPDRKLMDKISAFRGENQVAGVVTNVEEKRSKYGPYTVYKLAPHGVFWTRGLSITFDKGRFVMAEVNRSTGRAKSAREITI